MPSCRVGDGWGARRDGARHPGPAAPACQTDAVTVIDNAVYVDGRRVATPVSLDDTFEAAAHVEARRAAGA